MSYPRHNRDFGVEQDFLKFLHQNKYLVVNDPLRADWHYLPVFWTRWHLNHNYGENGLQQLQSTIDSIMINDDRTFTICQYDDGPLVNLGNTLNFLASRKTDSGFDIPLLCQRHVLPWLKQEKRYLASFVGRLGTHPIRMEMANEIRQRTDVFVKDGDLGTRSFVKKTLQSYIVLAPRGYGGSSFRFFEAMQLGVVPLFLGDRDCRPFKGLIQWDEASFYVDKVSEINSVLDSISLDALLGMGKRAAEIYKDHLTYQKWCCYVIKELQRN